MELDNNTKGLTTSVELGNEVAVQSGYSQDDRDLIRLGKKPVLKGSRVVI